jgi:putative ABC transport system permease protein
MQTGGGLVKIVGLDKARLRDFLDIEVDPEAWKEFVARRNGALLGADFHRDEEMKQRYVWVPGQEFVLADLGGLSLHMAGTFVARDPTLNSVLLTGDVFLQEVDGRSGVANQLLVRIRHRDESQAVGEAIDALDAPVKLHTETQQAARDQSIADLDEMLRYAATVMVVVGVVILLGLANAASMSVRDRVREIGVLRALGFTRRKIVALIAGESLVLALLGGLLGCAAAWTVIQVRADSVSVGDYAFPITLALTIVVGAVAASAGVGVLGGLPAGITASRRPIVESLRSTD